MLGYDGLGTSKQRVTGSSPVGGTVFTRVSRVASLLRTLLPYENYNRGLPYDYNTA